MPHDPLLGTRAKIERAKSHIDELERGIHAFREGRPYRVIPEDDPQTGDMILRLHVVECMPTSFGAIVGDVIHNLRSSLDVLINELVIANGHVPTNKTGFPISQTRQGFYTNGLKKLAGTNPRAIRIIKLLKPYQGGNEIVWRLHCLDIRDKHQLLIPVVVALAQTSIILGGGIEMGVMGTPMRAENGAVLATVPASARDPQTQYKFRFQILLDDRITTQTQAVKGLRQFLDFTERLVEIFRRYCI